MLCRRFKLHVQRSDAQRYQQRLLSHYAKAHQFFLPKQGGAMQSVWHRRRGAAGIGRTCTARKNCNRFMQGCHWCWVHVAQAFKLRGVMGVGGRQQKADV
jgi:hypothetical protein